MSPPRLSTDEKDAILAAYSAGEQPTAIAARFGVNPTYPRVLARRRGLAARAPHFDPTRSHPTMRWVLGRALRRQEEKIAGSKAAQKAAAKAAAEERQAEIASALAALDAEAKACFVRCRQGEMSLNESLSVAQDDQAIRASAAKQRAVN